MLRDVVCNYVSIADAEADYGVVLTGRAMIEASTSRSTCPRPRRCARSGAATSRIRTSISAPHARPRARVDARGLRRDDGAARDLPVHWRFFVKRKLMERLEREGSGAAEVKRCVERLARRTALHSTAARGGGGGGIDMAGADIFTADISAPRPGGGKIASGRRSRRRTCRSSSTSWWSAVDMPRRDPCEQSELKGRVHAQIPMSSTFISRRSLMLAAAATLADAGRAARAGAVAEQADPLRRAAPDPVARPIS